MHFNDIDELLKKGLLESSQYDELQTQKAKSRVWKAIEKPGKRQTIHWGFVSALAASITLFIICSVLYLKLESQQKLLEELQSYVQTPKQGVVEIPAVTFPDNQSDSQKVKELIPENSSVTMPEKVNTRHKKPNVSNHHRNKVGDRNLEERIPERMTIIPKLELSLPEIAVEDLKTAFILAPESQEDTQAGLEPNNTKKLKIKLGNSRNAYAHSQSLALNIKL